MSDDNTLGGMLIGGFLVYAFCAPHMHDVGVVTSEEFDDRARFASTSEEEVEQLYIEFGRQVNAHLKDVAEDNDRIAPQYHLNPEKLAEALTPK